MIAFITELVLVQKILTHLGLPAAPTQLAPARLPKELVFDFELDDHRDSALDEGEALVAAGPMCRAPPSGDFDL